MLHKAVKLDLKKGTSLERTFQDGKVMAYDMATLFAKYPQLVELKDRELFLQGKLVGAYGIIWNDNLDIECETIYEDGEFVRTENISAGVIAGNALNAARAQRGISQSELADKSRINQSDISKIERGVANPSVATLNRLAEALGMELKIEFT